MPESFHKEHLGFEKSIKEGTEHNVAYTDQHMKGFKIAVERDAEIQNCINLAASRGNVIER